MSRGIHRIMVRFIEGEVIVRSESRSPRGTYHAVRQVGVDQAGLAKESRRSNLAEAMTKLLAPEA